MGWLTPRPGRFNPGKDPVPIVQAAGLAPGPVWTGVVNLPHTVIRSPDRPARSELLYRLSYPGPLRVQISNEKCINTCQPIAGRTYTCKISVSPPVPAFFIGYSTLEDETTTLFRNVRHQTPSDSAPHSRRMGSWIYKNVEGRCTGCHKDASLRL
jgi:hypothetical protein